MSFPEHKRSHFALSESVSIGYPFQPKVKLMVPMLRIRSESGSGLLNLDPLVRGMDMDPDATPDPSITSKIGKKNLDSYCFVTSFCLFIFENLCKCTFKK